MDCATCDGASRGPIPSIECADPEKPFDMCKRKMPSTADPTCTAATATLCDPKLRTVNTGAECGADDDWYYFSPWRKPGSAGVFDSCGVAGGHPPPACTDNETHCFGGTYQPTLGARLGDHGSHTLPPTPTAVTWKAGDFVEVSWNILANHGGGYQYRLCPADATLDEECFQKTPLPFVGQQSLRWDGINGGGGTRHYFDGTYVSEGTTPAGSMWAKNPLPRNDTHQTLASFAPPCDETPDCGQHSRKNKCKCSGMWGPFNVEIVDTVALPAELPAGEYVLGWRWDCEESNQIWTSCSDVTIVGKDAAA